ncbi:hypothetical protein ACFE04_007452 [Oxalis oulophora]
MMMKGGSMNQIEFELSLLMLSRIPSQHLTLWSWILKSLFHPDVVLAIRTIPLAQGDVKDQWVWKENNNGVYSVKSGYHVACKILFGASSYQLSNSSAFQFWKKIWDISLPPQIRFFAWRLCNDTLPLKPNLLKKGMCVPSNCDICLDHEENSLHLFLNCLWSRGMWNILNLNSVMDYTGNSFFEWLNLCCINLIYSDLPLFFTTCWWIWKNRNKVVFDKACEHISSSAKNLLRWNNMQKLIIQSKTLPPAICLRPVNVWKPPNEGICKINSDATFTKFGSISYYGLAARNCKGEMIHAICGSSGLVETIFHAEAAAVEQAVFLAHKLQAQKPFSFGHPDVESITDRFLNEEKDEQVDGPQPSKTAERLNRQLNGLMKKLSDEKKRGEMLDKEILSHEQKKIDDLNLKELLDRKQFIKRIKNDIERKKFEMEISDSLLLLSKGRKVIN